MTAICDELEQRIQRQDGVAPKGTPRILLSGCPMAVPNWKLPTIIEKSGAIIVGEESCVGDRGVPESPQTCALWGAETAENNFK